ncbi:MAG: hypothetical protein K2W99_04865 [Chthoniobacterales bacterium]|nr:hypothetical protein [Chthoniobacterales bacterium]
MTLQLKKIKMEKLKISILLILILALGYSLSVFFVVKKQNIPEIEVYKFLETYSGATEKLQSINRGAPFNFLFANGVKSPLTFNLKLGKPARRGVQSLWVYTWQAYNHSQITIEYQGRTIGTVNNQVKEKILTPTLSYVGNLDIKRGNVVLNVTSSSNDPIHFFELGLAILAPEGMSHDRILNILKEKPAELAPKFSSVL